MMALVLLCCASLALASHESVDSACPVLAKDSSLLQTQKTGSRAMKPDENEDGEETSFSDEFWKNIRRHGDLDNIMPLAEAERRDELALERATADNFPSLPPMKFLLYPNLTEAHDSQIANKIKDLKRDSQITLPDGTTIPYWQTLQYANRNMRFFFTRFKNNVQCEEQMMSDTDQNIAWEWSMLLHKVLVTDCVKSYIESDTRYPREKFSGPFKGEPLSGAMFWRHVEADRRAAYIHMSGKLKSATAMANGKGIAFNNFRQFSERRFSTTIAVLAHEHAHNMGYHHRDRSPWGIQKAVQTCASKKAHKYTTHDLAEAALKEFTVQS